MKPVYQRLTHADFRDLAGPEIRVLRTLHSPHGVPYAAMTGMRINGKPITSSHMRLAANKVGKPESLAPMVDAPATRLLRRANAAAHLTYAAGLYDSLDQHWREVRSVDAWHLLSSWEIFSNSMSLGAGPFGPVSKHSPDVSTQTSVQFRDHWLTARALVSDLIKLTTCGDCGLPVLSLLSAPMESNWLMLPPSCVWCSFKHALKQPVSRGRKSRAQAPDEDGDPPSSLVLKVVR
jgi:hypothetical protein